jgi:hypothetical protein
MKRPLFVLALALAVMAGSSTPAPATTAAGDTYYPIGKNYKWVYSTDYSEDTELVHEVTGTEKVGDVECFIVEHKTVSPALGSRMMRKEWLSSNTDGVQIHKLQRGRSEMDVAKPFFKVKHLMRKTRSGRGRRRPRRTRPSTRSGWRGKTTSRSPRGSTRRGR